MAIGGFVDSLVDSWRTRVSDIEILSLNYDNINCKPKDFPSGIANHATVYVLGFGAVTCGGKNENRWTVSTCIVHSNSTSRNTFPSMNSPRESFSMSLVSNKLYSIGGYGTTDNMEIIDLINDSHWTTQMLPFSIYGHCAVTLGNYIIIIGGHEDDTSQGFIPVCINILK